MPQDVPARLDIGLICAPNHAANLCVYFDNRLPTLSHDEAFVGCELVAGGLSAPGIRNLYLKMWNNINNADLKAGKRMNSELNVKSNIMINRWPFEKNGQCFHTSHVNLKNFARTGMENTA